MVPLVFVDTQHYIRYMNAAGKKQYTVGDIRARVSLIATIRLQHKIKYIYLQLQSGTNEVLYSENDTRGSICEPYEIKAGNLMGYYERFGSQPSVQRIDPPAVVPFLPGVIKFR